ncbi:MAG: hypothetical protein ACPGQD_04485 [Planctomycetota bacterium]
MTIAPKLIEAVGLFQARRYNGERKPFASACFDMNVTGDELRKACRALGIPVSTRGSRRGVSKSRKPFRKANVWRRDASRVPLILGVAA